MSADFVFWVCVFVIVWFFINLLVAKYRIQKLMRRIDALERCHKNQAEARFAIRQKLDAVAGWYAGLDSKVNSIDKELDKVHEGQSGMIGALAAHVGVDLRRTEGEAPKWVAVKGAKRVADLLKR